jgi:uncharacterized protein YfcZ (UPF0381/DUF406 family)
MKNKTIHKKQTTGCNANNVGTILDTKHTSLQFSFLCKVAGKQNSIPTWYIQTSTRLTMHNIRTYT